VISSRSKCY